MNELVRYLLVFLLPLGTYLASYAARGTARQACGHGGQVRSFALAVGDASFGFFRHNFPPASIFLGDAGPLMLGFLLAALALRLDFVGPRAREGVIVLVIIGVPLSDALLVVIARIRGKRTVYEGRTDHSSPPALAQEGRTWCAPRDVGRSGPTLQLRGGAHSRANCVQWPSRWQR